MAELPTSLGATTSAIALVLCVIAAITVFLRTWVRIGNGAIGVDDYLMVIALIFFIPCCVITPIGCLSGIGAKDALIKASDPSGELNKHALKWFFVLRLIYFWCLPFVKSSICVALLRITSAKRFVVPVWIAMGLSIFGSVVGFSAMMDQCKPIATNWDMSLGQCKGTVYVDTFNIIVSAISILTDWLCAILPAILIWNLNMKPKVKALLSFVLALGVLASVSTCVRLRYMHIYKEIKVQPKDVLENAANLVIWSVLECGIGIIAGSLPPLQPLFRRYGFGVGSSRMKLTNEPHPADAPSRSYYRHRATSPAVPPSAAVRPVRLGSMKGAKRGHSLVTTCRAEASPYQQRWDGNSYFDDESSQKLVIVKNTRIDIEYDVERPATGPHR
ncbi:hypothetical protein F5Y05DRAFT_423921 [Hypoxylon sp. FL0543]|nr:hypothetical protein F5Y05DRAFT_423921 [Hypoxylon sp. FL0543]